MNLQKKQRFDIIIVIILQYDIGVCEKMKKKPTQKTTKNNNNKTYQDRLLNTYME